MIQLPGIAGTENNLLLFEFPKDDVNEIKDLIDNFKLINAVDFDTIILGSSDRSFGFRKKIHIWITKKDFDNASLMILLAYIIMGHKDWRKSEISIFAVFPEDILEREKQNLLQLIKDGQLPISPSNIQFIKNPDEDKRAIIASKSKMADLTIVGFSKSAVKHKGQAIFEGYDDIGDVLFVNASEKKVIK